MTDMIEQKDKYNIAAWLFMAFAMVFVPVSYTHLKMGIY